MDDLEKCRRLYSKLGMEASKPFFSGDRDMAFLRSKIRDELSTLELEHKFRHGIFDCILHEGFIRQSHHDYKLLAKAFEMLEVYCRLVRYYPWKTEYHTLKTYGGFFRTYIYSALPSCLEILQIIGYTPMQGTQAECMTKPTVLKLNSFPNIALLETIGFDCLAASVECEIRSDAVTNRMKHLQLDERHDAAMPNKLCRRSKPLMLVDRNTRKISSLPRELEPFPIDRFHTTKIMSSIAKTRFYHSEKLHIHQRRRNIFNLTDNSNYYGLRNVAYTTENKFTTLDEDPTN